MLPYADGRPTLTKIKTLRHARALRREATDTEMKLWAQLRGRRLADVKFRRQAPIGPLNVSVTLTLNPLSRKIVGEGEQSALAARHAA